MAIGRSGKKMLIICGSPRRGNSEAIAGRLKQIFDKMRVKNEILLLREKKIQRCNGCVEYCNHNLKCHHKDDMAKIMQKMLEAGGYVFVLPNYFAMPPGLFKDFIDKCSIFYTAQTDLSAKRAAVISVGTDLPYIKGNVHNVAKNFCETLKIKVVATGAFVSRSELEGNYNDIFENKLNPGIEKDLEKIANKLCDSLKRH
jgi:multimeric flavodoxin WrbA